MIITRVDESPTRPNPHGVESKTIYDHSHGQITHLTIQPGQRLKRHITPVDVAFYIIEGECDVEIGEDVQRVGRDTLIESPAEIPHALVNPGTLPLRVLVMKLPRPTKKTVLL
ncbi:MAG: cupin domain-containing protein [Euryarchaeota archaeon]|nr:cupin domain-containing protein [Euryarchaeota archaeon]